MAPEREHDTVNFTSLAPLSLRMHVKMGWSFHTIQRDIKQFCGEETVKLVERLVIDELSEPILFLCNNIEQNVLMVEMF
jgi:hypothetical protein